MLLLKSTVTGDVMAAFSRTRYKGAKCLYIQRLIYAAIHKKGLAPFRKSEILQYQSSFTGSESDHKLSPRW